MKIKIGKKNIGEDEKAYLILEIARTYENDLEKAKEMHNDEITKSMNVAFIDALKIRDENYKSPYEDWEQYYNETFGGNQ